MTGASSGIGAEIARDLASRGHSLLLVARRQAQLEALAEELRSEQVQVWVHAQDLGITDAAESLESAVTELGLQVDILVNNAGFGIEGPFMEMEADRLRTMVQLNMTTLTELTLLFGRDMAEREGGHIMQVASCAAFLPSPYVAAYAATKHYVKAFSEALTFELRHSKVSVTTLYPGITTTEFYDVTGSAPPALMRMSVLDAKTVARVGVRAMLKRKRAIIPGFINKLNAFFSAVLPRGVIIWSAGHILESSEEHK